MKVLPMRPIRPMRKNTIKQYCKSKKDCWTIPCVYYIERAGCIFEPLPCLWDDNTQIIEGEAYIRKEDAKNDNKR